MDKLMSMRPTCQVAGGIAAAVCVLALVGCGSPAAVSSHITRRSTTAAASPATPGLGPSESSPSRTSDRTNGVLHGQVVRPPGVDPRSGRRSGPAVPVNGDPVQVHDLRGRVVTGAVTKSGGFFSIALPPGQYRIVEDICGVSKEVTIRSGSATHVILKIPKAC